MSASITRLTLYALIAAIESDLRSTLAANLPHAGNLPALFGEKLFEKLAERADLNQEENNRTLEELLELCDFGDAFQLANKYREHLPDAINTQLRNLDQPFKELIATRNRVMHARPLEFDDLPNTIECVTELLRNAGQWQELSEIKAKLTAEPEYALKLTIPFEPEPSTISHNLPLTDFDETGFIGRKGVAGNLKKAILGVYPVITVVGEGGLGKTSLALKVAYDLLDNNQEKFDAIIFVSAKTQKLTSQEIERIKNSINTSVGLVAAAAEALGGAESKTLDDLVDLLTQFRVLLIIDNLETVLDENMRNLMEQVPIGSKILITTRIRMGAFEFPIQLEPLSPSEATKLLRTTARVRECSRLVSMSDTKLEAYCKRMRNSPLHIKWFVSAVQAGQRPEAVLADEKLFLQFCLSNVFNVLGDEARRLVRTLLSLGGSYTVAELSYLTSLDQTALLKAIGELTRTNMFFAISTPTDRSFETKYELSQLARAYLSKFYPVNKEEQQRLLRHKQTLVSAGEQIQSEADENPIAPGSIHCRTRSDWVTAKYLREALAAIRSEKIDEALELIETAKSLAPDFSEVHRVEAFAHAKAGNLTSAFDCYERAIEFDPESAVGHFLFGGFLLRDVHDTEAAVREFQRATELCPNNIEPKLELTRALLYLKQFEKAAAEISQMESLTIAHERLRRKLTDLHLQLLTRQTDQFQMTQQPKKAVEELEKVRTYYNGLVGTDFKMRERVIKLRYTAQQLRSSQQISESELARVEDVIGWIDGVARGNTNRTVDQTEQLDMITYGHIRSVHKSGNFGQIQQDDGRNIFFHMNRARDSKTLNVNQRVKFKVAIDWRGRIFADEVSASQ